MIRVERVTMRYPVPKRYRDFLLHPLRPARRVLALSEIDLSIRRGRSVALLGPNGVGKTTLLKLIGGLLYPTEGSVLVDGVDTVKDNVQARRRVGFVINEERSFYWRLTGIENLEFFGTLQNLSPAPLARRIAELLELVGLQAAGDKRVADYSTGMKQRLAIARGLIADPDILLLDEPTRSLDPLGAGAIRELIAGGLHAGRRRTLVVATNALADVTQLCDRVFVLRSSRIVGSCRVSSLDEEGVAEFYRERIESRESHAC